MLNSFLKSRIPEAKRLVRELRKKYDYVSVLGTVVNTRQIMVSTHLNSFDEVDNECGFVLKLYKDGRYSEYSCNDIKGLKANEVVKAVTLDKVVSADYKEGGNTVNFNISIIISEKTTVDFLISRSSIY